MSYERIIFLKEVGDKAPWSQPAFVRPWLKAYVVRICLVGGLDIGYQILFDYYLD